MAYKVHDVDLDEEFKICPLCGYEDGFHTMLKKVDGKIKKLYICPRCHAVFNPKTDLPEK